MIATRSLGSERDEVEDMVGVVCEQQGKEKAEVRDDHLDRAYIC